MDATILAAALGSGLVAGTFFAFSNFIMAGLARLPQHDGASAMRSINITVINPLFLTTLLGTGVLCAGLMGLVAMGHGQGRPWTLLAAGALYLVGSVGITGAKNVPLNDQLEEADDANLSCAWSNYLARWTFWNHVRTASALVACGLLIESL
ncbi:MAG: DUF1772 domain-containing protein [Planctomycetota bacterium]|nr:DUF1772 domain-containing protein [Planctomycetota bacterium]